MRQLISLILFCGLISGCTNKPHNPLEKTIDYVISTRDNFTIEFPGLYDSLTNHINNDSSERIILVEALKKRNFKIVDWGRGNYPPLGPRIISVKMKNGDCFCQIDKIYYKTISDSLYQMTERIRCSDSLTFADP